MASINPLFWQDGYEIPGEARTPQQKELLALSDTLLAEPEQADEYVFGVPMHNFGVPSVLKLWIDQIARLVGTDVLRTLSGMALHADSQS